MTATQTNRKVTLLVQNLRRLVMAVPPENRYPALETVLCRGRHFCDDAPSSDHFRFSLFGIKADGELPVAALTREADSANSPQPHQYWLRTDPVTLWADMARLFIVSHGLTDLDEFDRNEIENTVRSVLLEEGIQLHTDHPDRWSIALGEPLEFDFPALDDVLGKDVSEIMQEQPQALQWRRITNEIQMALHSSPVNVRRRQKGQREINSVWFWGGGFIPPASDQPVFETVYSDNPVSQGLASINDCQIRTLSELHSLDCAQLDSSVLIDWNSDLVQPELELDYLESLVQTLVEEVCEGGTGLRFFCGDRHGWEFARHDHRKFWRRRRQLGDVCNKTYPE